MTLFAFRSLVGELGQREDGDPIVVDAPTREEAAARLPRVGFYAMLEARCAGCCTPLLVRERHECAACASLEDDEPTQPMKRPSFVDGLVESVSETRIAVDARCESIRRRAAR
jgi:hypothetical protein